MKKAIIILILLITLLMPKATIASTLEIQILKTRIQILQLQIQYLIMLLSEINLMSETQQVEIKEIEVQERAEEKETIKPIEEEKVKEEIKQIIPPLLEMKCPGGKAVCA